MHQQKQPRKGRKVKRSGGGPKGRPANTRRVDSKHPKADDKYKYLPMKTVEQRKAAQLEKWRKELGLDETA